MAYLRGDTYIYASNVGIHFWSKNGKEDVSAFEWSDEQPDAGGIRLGFKEVDEFVLLRFAEIISDKDVPGLTKDIERICSENRNFGAESLRTHKDKILNLLNSKT